mgnify:CR=1 FL=1
MTEKEARRKVKELAKAPADPPKHKTIPATTKADPYKEERLAAARRREADVYARQQLEAQKLSAITRKLREEQEKRRLLAGLVGLQFANKYKLRKSAEKAAKRKVYG